MKALVTGATGFIGAHLVPRLRQAGHDVRALVRPATDARRLEQLGAEIVRGDVCAAADVERIIEGCEVIFHLAVDRMSRPVVVDATVALARAALPARILRFVFSSSTAVYGRSRSRRVDERSNVEPDSRYGNLKVEVENRLRELHENEGLPLVIARLPLVLGPGGRGWKEIFAAIAAGKFRLVGDGRNRYQPVDVSDVVEGLMLCATVRGIEGRTYVLASEEARPLREIVDSIAEEFGVSVRRSRIPAWVLRAYGGLNRMAVARVGKALPRFERVGFFLVDRRYDLSLARRDLGYSPRIAVEATVRRTARWYRDQALAAHAADGTEARVG